MSSVSRRPERRELRLQRPQPRRRHGRQHQHVLQGVVAHLRLGRHDVAGLAERPLRLRVRQLLPHRRRPQRRPRPGPPRLLLRAGQRRPPGQHPLHEREYHQELRPAAQRDRSRQRRLRCSGFRSSGGLGLVFLWWDARAVYFKIFIPRDVELELGEIRVIRIVIVIFPLIRLVGILIKKMIRIDHTKELE